MLRPLLRRVREGEYLSAYFNWDINDRHARLITPGWYCRVRWPWYAWSKGTRWDWILKVERR